MKERFLKYVHKTDYCWEWIGGISTSGYGKWWDSEKQLRTSAHRGSYELFIGDIPDGMFVCHTCDNRACVNPKHLWVGTNQDNIIDAAQKGRVCGQKLKQEDVVNIRSLVSIGYMQEDVAERYSVSRQTINRIINRVIHSYV